MPIDSAIHKGGKIPSGYREMAASACSRCKASFLIIHEYPFADADRAKVQAALLAGILGGEHVDEKFVRHLDLYEDLDSR